MTYVSTIITYVRSDGFVKWTRTLDSLSKVSLSEGMQCLRCLEDGGTAAVQNVSNPLLVHKAEHARTHAHSIDLRSAKFA